MADAFESAFTHAPIGMVMVDMAGHPLRVNDALCRITGFTSEQIVARPFRDLSDPRDIDIDASQFADLLDGKVAAYQCEKRFRHAWGPSIWVLLNVSLVRNEAGEPQHVLAQVQDISERKALESRLEQLVDHDFLTGLFNRRHFEHALAQETKNAARYSSGGAVLLLDLDHFKEVNDQFGHKAGDDLLKAVAAALRNRIRETDILARLGGDEFGIIMPQGDRRQAEVVADGLVKALRQQTAALAEQKIPVTASVGIAMFDGLTSIELLAAADMATYEAKAAGRDRFAFYHPAEAAGHPPHASRLVEAEQIRRAIAGDQLELFCQPILDLTNNRISQYELLVRLRTDGGELLAPSAFLYVAERFDTVMSIDAWVVRQAVAIISGQARRGRAVTLNVNVSAKSLGHPELIETIDRALGESGIDPARLVFELTETAAIGNMEHAKSFTDDLRSRGCRLALDDFGTGFGSFYYLKHLPFDYFKIDGDFIGGYGANTTDQLVVDAIVGIAKGMAKKTVAEFVTDAEVMDRLRRSGVDYAQGFHVGVPCPVAEVF